MADKQGGLDFNAQSLFDEAHDAFIESQQGAEAFAGTDSQNPFNFMGEPPPEHNGSTSGMWSTAPQPDALSMLRGGIRKSSASGGRNGEEVGDERHVLQRMVEEEEYDEHEYEQAAVATASDGHTHSQDGLPTSASVPTNDAQFFDQSLRPWENTGYSLLVSDESCASEQRWDDPNPEQREFHGLTTNFVENWRHFAGNEADDNFESASDLHFAAMRSLVRSFAAVCHKRVSELQLMESRDNVENKSLQWLRVERNTWWLLDTLLAIWSEPRDVVPPGGHPFFSGETDAGGRGQLPADLHYGDEFLAVHKLSSMNTAGNKSGDADDEGTEMELPTSGTDLLIDLKSKEANRASALYQSLTRIVTWFENCALQEMNQDYSDLASETGSRVQRRHNESASDPDAGDREGSILPTNQQFRKETLLKQVWELVRAGRLERACNLCRTMGEHWRAASLQGAIVGGLHLSNQESNPRDIGSWTWVGNPSRFLFKQIAWEISEKAGNPGEVAVNTSRSGSSVYSGSNLGTRQSMSTSQSSTAQYERAMYAKLSGNMQALLSSTSVCPSWEDRCWAVFSCMCERLRDDAIVELRAIKQAASDPIDDEYLGKRFSNAGQSGNGTRAFGSVATGVGWMDHQPGPPDAAAASEILLRTEQANTINCSERPSEEVFNMVNAMDGGIKAGTTVVATVSHRKLQSNLIMGSLRSGIKSVDADSATCLPTQSGGGVDLSSVNENGDPLVDPLSTSLDGVNNSHISGSGAIETQGGFQGHDSDGPNYVDHELMRFCSHLLICYDFLGRLEDGRFSPAAQDSVPTGHDHDRVLASYVDFLVSRRQYSLVAVYCASMHSAQTRRVQYGGMLSKIIDNGRRFMCSTLAVRHFGGGGGLDAVAYASELIWMRDEVGGDPLTKSEEAALCRVMADLRVLHRLPVEDFAKVWGISLLLDVPKNVPHSHDQDLRHREYGNAVPFTTRAYDWLAEAVKQTNALVRHLLLRSAMTSEKLALASTIGRDKDSVHSHQALLTVTGDALPAVYFLLLGLPMVESQGFAAVPAMMNEDVVRELEHSGVDRLSAEDVWEYKCLANYARAHRSVANWWRIYSTVVATSDKVSSGGRFNQENSAGVVRSTVQGVESRRAEKILKEHCASLQSSVDAAARAIEDLLVQSFGKEWADHERRMYEENGRDQEQQQYMQALIKSTETDERTQQLALLWRVIVPEMSRLLVRIHADSRRWYAQIGENLVAVHSLSRAMQVADMVAGEDVGNLSDAFSRGHLQVFLEDIRQVGVDLLKATGEDEIKIDPGLP